MVDFYLLCLVLSLSLSLFHLVCILLLFSILIPFQIFFSVFLLSCLHHKILILSHPSRVIQSLGVPVLSQQDLRPHLQSTDSTPPLSHCYLLLKTMSPPVPSFIIRPCFHYKLPHLALGPEHPFLISTHPHYYFYLACQML